VLPVVYRLSAQVFQSEQLRDNSSVKQVREGTVSNIVHQPRHCDILDVTFLNVVNFHAILRFFISKLDLFKVSHLLLGEVAYTKAVRESGVGCTWKNHVEGT
jgi:hypothetical protein